MEKAVNHQQNHCSNKIKSFAARVFWGKKHALKLEMRIKCTSKQALADAKLFCCYAHTHTHDS